MEEVLSSVVDDGGAQLLHDLLSSPWLHALLKMYECLLQFRMLTPRPFLPHASGLSHEIVAAIQKIHHLSAEARDLCRLLSSPHIQALLASHDSVAHSDYGPVLLPSPDEWPEDEQVMRIVCLVKNNQPLNGGEGSASVGDGDVISRRQSSFRRPSLDRLVAERGVWSGKELRQDQSEARLLAFSRGERSRPFLPRYQSTESCRVRPRTYQLNQSAPSVFTPAGRTDSHSVSGGSSDDYAHPPPPVPAYSVSLPNSPVLYKKGIRGGQSRNIPTPGRAPSCPGMKHFSVHTAPTAQRTSCQQGVRTLPTLSVQTGPQNIHHQDSVTHPTMHQQSSATAPAGGQNAHRQPKPVAVQEQCSVEDLRSVLETVVRVVKQPDDVCRLGIKLVAATEMTADRGEANTQVLCLLDEVVDKIQGLIGVKKRHELLSPCRSRRCTPPGLPPWVSSISPNRVSKPLTPVTCGPQHLSSSSSSSSSSSLSSFVSSCADGFPASRIPKQMKRGSDRAVLAGRCTQGPNGGRGNRLVRLNNGSFSKGYNDTGCLKAKKK